MADEPIDDRAPWAKLTNIAAAISSTAVVAALIWPEQAEICHAIAGVFLALLGVGVAKRVARYGENGKE